MADGKETAYVPQIILARGLWMVSATMRSWRITALANQEQIALTAERAMITCAILVEVIIRHHRVVGHTEEGLKVPYRTGRTRRR